MFCHLVVLHELHHFELSLNDPLQLSRLIAVKEILLLDAGSWLDTPSQVPTAYPHLCWG